MVILFIVTGKVRVGVSIQRGFPDTYSLTRRFSMKQKRENLVAFKFGGYVNFYIWWNLIWLNSKYR